jgi:hexosaminidase
MMVAMPSHGRQLACGTACAVLLWAAGHAAAAVNISRTMSSPAAALPTFASIIPRPVAATQGRGTFILEPSAAIRVGPSRPEARRVAEYLAGLLRPATGYPLPVLAAPPRPAPGDVSLTTAPGLRSLGAEGYRLRITSRGVTLSAFRPEGLFRGVQTLRQLFPAPIETRSLAPGPWHIRAGTVRDRPRFPWRGAMLDVARHFFGVDDVKRYIDLLALYKLNHLHLHLSDDQGWRIAIRSWPRLANVGGTTAVGGGPGGWYTQRQYADLVAYAQSRYITVVPEIDMPGHTHSALASYAKLNCDGRAPELYHGIDVGFSSLCIRKEVTYSFVDDVIGELAALTPGPYVHVGGDEAKATSPDDYLYFVDRVQRIVQAHGKRLVGWEEIARAPLARASVAQHWFDAALARRAVAQGMKVIMSPATKAYLDMKYTPETTLGLSWAGTTDVRDAYTWDPATQVDGVGERDVLGVEAPLWSETTATLADVEFLAFPRLIGHAEIAWSPRAGRAWQSYRWRLAAQGPRLRALGVDFYESPQVPWR